MNANATPPSCFARSSSWTIRAANWRSGAALQGGAHPVIAYPDGYHSGLIVTVALVAAGAVVSYPALRRLPRQPTTAGVVPATAAALSGSAEPELA
jgi:hypothetical protein